MFNHYLFDQILVPAVFMFFLISGLFGLGIGIALMIFRQQALRFFAPMNRWVSARERLEPLETRREIEPFVYRYRRWFSALFVLGGAFSMFMLLMKVDAGAVASLFGAARLSIVGPWIVQSIAAILVFGSALAVAIGAILGFFPQALAHLETRTNRWYSSRQVLKGADDMHMPLDRWFASSPRLAGGMLALAALIVVINSAVVLLGSR